MIFRSTPLILAAVAVLVTASLLLGGCGSGGSKTTPTPDATITQVTVYPTVIPAAGGFVNVHALTTGGVQAPEVSIARQGGSSISSVQMQPNNGDYSDWTANAYIDPNTGADAYIVATVSGTDTKGTPLVPVTNPSQTVIQYGPGAGKRNITLWGVCTAFKTGVILPLQANPIITGDAANTVSSSTASKDTKGQFQISFIGKAGGTYLLTLDAGLNYYKYQAKYTVTAGVNDMIQAKFTSTDDAPPPPPL